jgi:hypothetical protein
MDRERFKSKQIVDYIIDDESFLEGILWKKLIKVFPLHRERQAFILD